MLHAKRHIIVKVFTLLLLLMGWQADAQTYNNEWINYSQKYYKFKLVRAGVYRIPKAVLDAVGLGEVSVQNFELWRNGERVPFYPSVPEGALPASGYLEFWGMPNDGKPDRPLYRNPAFQHTTAHSLILDTATYFLSVNTNQSGFRVKAAANNISANTLPAEPYLMYTFPAYFKNRINPGFAAFLGEYVYSSSYDRGEFWSSPNITPATPYAFTWSNLFAYSGGPSPAIRFGAVGNAQNKRSLRVLLNNSVMLDSAMDFFNDLLITLPVLPGLIASNSAEIRFVNTSSVSADRMAASFAELTYPRQFNFGGQQNFEFTLPADNDGYYLEISNFNYGSLAPVLYDLTNGNRYTGDISDPAKIRFALPPQATQTRLVLVSQDPANITLVGGLSPREFIRFQDPANQGDYLIIYHPMLNATADGRKPVDEYAAYRTSARGGAFSVRTVDIEELADQFSFGIRHHPLSVRNFILYARSIFAQPLKNIFIIGRGMTYNEYRSNLQDPLTEKLNLVPTFGSPGSDNLLSAADLTSAFPQTPIGRLSVVTGTEIADYLEKVKETELQQQTAPNTLAGKQWMKNVVHVTGASDAFLGTVLCNYMSVYRDIIEDTLYGARVSTFCKTSTNPEEQVSSDRIRQLFENGMSMLTYFGHSSATTLEFNIDNPQNYNNQGKYPAFFVNGCNAGNFFTYYPQRLQVNETLSEKFVLARQRGAIAFVASTHFGIVNYLNIYLNNLYASIGKKRYGASLGQINQASLQGLLAATSPSDFYARIHAEEITLHGDPAVKLNLQVKPDYIIEDPLVTINPSFISIAESDFRLLVKVANTGKAVKDSVRLEIKRQFPDGSFQVLYNQKRPAIKYEDSVSLTVPIIATRDKGSNKIIATIDPDNQIGEIEENNNSVTKEFFIYEDEARPVYPYNLSIVNTPGQKLFASTANPFSGPKNYVLELDTTEAFNSPSRVSKTISSSGGVLEFEPGIVYRDSIVYYWRVAAATTGEYRWNKSSFIFLSGNLEGFNQSHYYQFTRSRYDQITLDSTSRKLFFDKKINNLFIRNGVYPFSGTQDNDFSITVNNDILIRSACVGSSLIFCVFDPVTFKPWRNVDANGNNLFRYGSGSANCAPGRQNNFEFSYQTAASRKKIMDFMDSIPAGAYVTVRSIDASAPNSFSATWRSDTALYGPNNSLYHKLLAAGFTDIDSLNRRQSWAGVYKKEDYNFQPKFKFSNGLYDGILLTADCPTPDSLGFITSPRLGPARQWDKVLWSGRSLENPSNDNATIEVIGIDKNYEEVVLYTLDHHTREFDISSVNAVEYPYMKLRMRNLDSTSLTPFQLGYWRIHYKPMPEGALAPGISFTAKDTVEAGEPFNFTIAFKNVSKAAFDSLRARLIIIDKNNVSRSIPLSRFKPLASGDTVVVKCSLDTREYAGRNTLYLDINPDNDQPEEYHFNNFLYWNFFVKADQLNPLLDVTFDGVHILNRDIVSARPHILIKLKDEARYLLLNDTSLLRVQVRYPDGTLRPFRYDNDTLRFTPALSGTDNTATIDFAPQFSKQYNPEGDEYELIVQAKDRSNNKVADVDYKVVFQVISKPMISNLLNYPNPFSTATAFVFTLTGSDIPEQFKIQILTVTGRVVREITKDELGPLHIGRNITSYKWDGTDQFGQPLANGVYLYRVVTTLNGKTLDKYRSEGESTNKFFNNGYGKMYLMR